jgi:aspartyl protease family protein
VRISHSISLLLACAALPALGAEVSLIGVFPPKAAVLVIDGSAPKSVRVGGQAGAVRLIAVESDHAVIEDGGVRRTVPLGQHYPSAAAPASARQSVALAADSRGHFVTEATVNGGPVRFLVDTGASMVALPAADAHRLGIDYRKGRVIPMQTANGATYAYLVKLHTVKLGAIELHDVDAAVHERGLDIGLLGMSFLNRVEMKNEGQTMLLTRRY